MSIDLLSLALAKNYTDKQIEKANLGDGIEKTTIIDKTSTNTQVPSAKAVFNFVNEMIGVIENGTY